MCQPAPGVCCRANSGPVKGSKPQTPWMTPVMGWPGTEGADEADEFSAETDGALAGSAAGAGAGAQAGHGGDGELVAAGLDGGEGEAATERVGDERDIFGPGAGLGRG